jgi:hypothetical protein
VFHPAWWVVTTRGDPLDSYPLLASVSWRTCGWGARQGVASFLREGSYRSPGTSCVTVSSGRSRAEVVEHLDGSFSVVVTGGRFGFPSCVVGDHDVGVTPLSSYPLCVSCPGGCAAGVPGRG